MNVLDWVLIALFAFGALWGFRTGLVDAALNVVAIYVALVLSGQFAGRILGLFTDSVESEALSKAIGYVIIFIAVFLAARLASHFVKRTLKQLSIGWVDDVGGALVGILAGLLLAGGLMAVMARFAYVVDNSESNNVVTGAVEFAERFLDGGVRSRVDSALVNSEVTGVLLDVRNVLPGGMLGMAPADFNTALDVLDQRREAMKT